MIQLEAKCNNQGGILMKTGKTTSLLLAALALLAFGVPASASEKDRRIESSASQSYVFKTYLQSDDIKIQSREGAVTMTGTVSDISHKGLARDTVAGLPGVKSVTDRLEVQGVAGGSNSDAWLRGRVKATLLLHRSVRGVTTVVDVKDGMVTLRGEAASLAQKELTAEYAKNVDGVRDVHNEMSVAQSGELDRTVGEKLDDASITSLVKLTLLYHRSSSALNTEVQSRLGVVTLTGTASNRAQLELATRLANDVYGVKEVRNRMSIE
jgi:hyperosmotically inducible periplasmic protein